MECPKDAAGARATLDHDTEQARALANLARALEARVHELERHAEDVEARLAEIEESLQ